MMTNLFSMFDPSTSTNLSMNWMSIAWIYFFFPSMFFINKNRFMMIKKKMSNYIIGDMKSNITKKTYKVLFIFMIFFMSIFMMNYLSIFPFTFTPTAHLSVTIFLSSPFWINLMIKGWKDDPIIMFAHLVPLGSPFILSPFMVIIESVSNLIRPLTLCVRLTANLIAGHILMALLSNMLDLSHLIFFSSSLVLNLLMILEFSVALIQSYVFIVLLSLYLSEI